MRSPDCKGLRYYHGRDEDGKPNLVLVGVDKVCKDLTKASIMERSGGCPQICDIESPFTMETVAWQSKAATIRELEGHPESC